MDPYGNSVIATAINTLSVEFIDFVVTELLDKMHAISVHQYGSFTIKQLFLRCRKESWLDSLDSLIQELYAHSEVLLKDRYGSSVLQCMLKNGRPEDQQYIFEIVLENVF